MIVQTTEEKETTEDDDFIPVTTSNKKNKKNRSFFNFLDKSNKGAIHNPRHIKPQTRQTPDISNLRHITPQTMNKGLPTTQQIGIPFLSSIEILFEKLDFHLF